MMFELSSISKFEGKFFDFRGIIFFCHKVTGWNYGSLYFYNFYTKNGGLSVKDPLEVAVIDFCSTTTWELCYTVSDFFLSGYYNFNVYLNVLWLGIVFNIICRKAPEFAQNPIDSNFDRQNRYYFHDLFPKIT